LELRLGEWFRLPRLGKDVFALLVREAGLKYVSGKGFMVTPQTDLRRVKAIIEDVLGERVEISVRCYLCGGDAGCGLCPYNEVCDRTAISHNCLCQSCLSKEDAYTLYTLKAVSDLQG
jgi:hypothetical protein